METIVNKSKLGHYAWKIIRALLLISLCYIILFPLLAKVLSSIMVESDMYDQTVKWIPKTITFNNYVDAWNNMKYPVAFLNSMKLVLTVSILQLFSSTVIGYGLARFNIKGGNILFGLVIFTLLVPPQTLLISNYLNYRFYDLMGILSEPLNLLGTMWPFILMSVTGVGLRGGLFIYIMRQFFIGMPSELEEAAYVDGAGPYKTFFKVMLPSAVPAMVIVFLFSFVWQYNEYFLTTILMGNQTILPVTLADLTRTIASGGGITHVYAALVNSTGMLLYIAPVLIVFIILQRYVIETVTSTGIVG